MRFCVSLALFAAAAGCGRFGFGVLGDDTTDDARGDGVLAADADIPDSAVLPNVNFVFVTSTAQLPGAIGGLAGADAICNMRAAAAGLSGNFKAWLSTTTVTAGSRLGNARGWQRPDGAVVVDQILDLIAGRLWYPPRLDENGVDRTNRGVYTATRPDGSLDTTLGTCTDWTVADTTQTRVGTAGASAAWWTNRTMTTCDTPMSLYCFGVDRTTPVVPMLTTGRYAFYSAGWRPGGGLAGADAKCQADATAASLPGTYRALLATSTASAASRFDLTKPTWVRYDGLALAATPTDFMHGNLRAALDLDATGASVGGATAWTGYYGASGDGFSLAVANQHCSDWMSMSNAANGAYGDAALASPSMLRDYNTACNATTIGLYCLQE